MAGRCNLDKIRKAWIILSTVLLSFLCFAFYGENDQIAYKFFVWIADISMVCGLLTYESRAHVAAQFFAIYELLQVIALITLKEKVTIGIEFYLSIIAVLSTLYLVIRAVIKNNKLSIKEIYKVKFHPYNTTIMIRAILIMLIVTVIFSLTNNMMESQENITWLSMSYMMLPTIIYLFTIIPMVDAIILRIVYYVFWIYILEMGIEVGVISQVTLIEPILYLISLGIGSRWIESFIKKREKVKNNTTKSGG